jgi:hypothetical protein
MIKLLLAVLACAALAGCAASAPPATADDADAAACTAQADATYHALDEDQLARTSQAGLLYGAQPTHVFDAEQMGAMHARDSELTQCEQNGNNSAPEVAGVPVVTPHIVSTP